jgi:glycosyltransferase involved in cell wall biosynthesis
MAVHSAKPAGAQLVALGQAAALATDFRLTISVRTGPLRARFARHGEIVRGPTRLPVWGASRRRWALEVARAVPDAIRLAGLIRRRRLSVVVANSTVLVAPVLAARLAGVPVIVHAQEAPKSAAVRSLYRVHGALADTVVAISPWIAAAFGPSPRARVLLNPVGIDVPPRVARAPRGGDGPLRLAVVGTIDRHKRQDLAVRALAELRGRGVAARLALIGPEPDAGYGAEVRGLARELGVADGVEFTGQVDDVAHRLRETDVLVLPAGEVTPLVLMEAMALETPVVAARMGSIPDVVLDGDTGLLVPPDDAAGFGAAIARIAADPEAAARMSELGRARVEEHFDEARSHARLRAEIERLLGVSPAR